MNEEKSNFGRNLSYLLIGGGIGAILALLFAPKAGEAFRADIANAARTGIDKTGEFAADLSETAQTAYEDAKLKAGDAYVAVKDKINVGAAALAAMPINVEHAVLDKMDEISAKIAH
ncbi:MAG: YtxH domain-containing protein [Acidobacteria bacterium]|nr:YtxH domain-containing protein [Acidobacteriota bacterium]MBK8147390.1 YtxH domain-containing protein [Acidobacteriota bacterium]MBK8810565.1 YtxH domain-containing protein [Acidobacteriota bacterium]